MNRRTSLCGLTLGTLAAPRGVEAQHTEKRPRIGYLQGPQNENVVAFIQGLHDAGYVDGQTAVIETRMYPRAVDRPPQFANELARLKCDVIFAAAPYAIAAAIRATSTIPIVGIDRESDPVARG